MTPILKKLLKPAFKAVASIGLSNPHSPYELELMVAGVKPVAIVGSDELHARLYSEETIRKWHQCVEDGRIVHIGSYQIPDDNLAGLAGEWVRVFAQADKIEDGKEVFARYYNNDEGYPPLPPIEWNIRIGKLLGYTDNDVALVSSPDGPLTKAIMKATDEVGHRARRYYLLEYGALEK